MIHSIRRFLFISLFISITIASSMTAIGNYLLDTKIIKPYLDSGLLRAFRVIQKLSEISLIDKQTNQKIQSYLDTDTSNSFMFQIWGNNGKLLFHSTNSHNLSLKNTPAGFSDLTIQDSDWRAYAKYNIKLNTKTIVAERYETRNELSDRITRNNGYILLVSFPIFVILIWLIVGLALRSVTKVTNEISNRASTYLEPVDTSTLPVEIKPLVVELNHLFNRLKLAFDRNKRFAGDAAHELRTPLAALKTQTQVALIADNPVDRNHALNKILEGVDRSSHVVAQLLTLSRLSQEETLHDVHPVDLQKVATEIIAYLVPIALEKNIDIELSPPPPHTTILGNDTILGILIRNIVDNAIRYTPQKGSVKVTLLNTKNEVIFRVLDTGPGIPLELRERVFERFYRILGTEAAGSGLGLAIVNQITELHHGMIHLNTPENGMGLQFDIVFPMFKN